MARNSFVDDHHNLDRFDAVFADVYDTEMGRLPTDQRGQQQPLQTAADDKLAPVRRSSDEDADTQSTLPWATLPSVAFAADDDSDDDSDEPRWLM